MDHKGYASAPTNAEGTLPVAAAYHQPMQSAYPHPQPPPAYTTNPPPYQDAPLGTSMPYHPPPTQHQVPTVVHTVYQTQVGPEPTRLTCPSCREAITTKLDYETTTKTHIMAGILCAFICWPCAWIPYVMDSCKNANHYCPNCGCFVGTYRS